ncbi:Imm7 family immunity protein [Streptomyces fenghuangensis]|uniref:Imm7 family immunity protein n=1 Tax=Streptomyces chitinivorans TaxID=1257027 RepID=A0ABW7HRT8_9ACTN|nr:MULTISPECIES: Imm7 family immunity protein [Streptomyces]MCG3042919.1 immunity 7 family protein [Streptomyces sp. ICN903]MDH2411459.1 Imm7 family immunity protein [Streptomyces chitinivorans]
MCEFHGWFGVAESPEESEAGGLEPGINELRARIADIKWSTADAELRIYNGQYFVTVNGLVNRRRDEATELEELLRYIATRFPGSWGLLYERSADMEEPPGQNAFRVRVMARGEIHTRLDPFLSPTRPVIEE